MVSGQTISECRRAEKLSEGGMRAACQAPGGAPAPSSKLGKGVAPKRERRSRQRPVTGWTVSCLVCLLGVSAIGTEPKRDRYVLSPSYEVTSPEQKLAESVNASKDVYVSEVYTEQIVSKLSELSRALKESPPKVAAVSEILADSFRATPLKAQEVALRRAPPLQLFRSSPDPRLTHDRTSFAEEFQSLIAAYERILTAEFEVVGITLPSDPNSSLIETRIHYNIVGPGTDSWRVQQTGEWLLEWSRSTDETWLVRTWRMVNRIRAAASRPLFVDVSEQALGANRSYRGQLRRGADHWRSTLDGAIGIDAYSHHGVSVGDIDNDGDDDFYLSQASGLPNRLFRNDGGFSFTDVSAGLAPPWSPT